MPDGTDDVAGESLGFSERFPAGRGSHNDLRRGSENPTRRGLALAAEGCLPAHVRPLKIAFLRSITVEPVIPLFPAALAARDFAAAVEVGQLGDCANEMLADDSFVVRGKFDVCVVLVPLESLLAAAGDPRARIGDVGQDIAWFLHGFDVLAVRFSGLILVCNFAHPPYSLARRFQLRNPDSSRYAIGQANRLLAEHARAHRNIVISDVEYLRGGSGLTTSTAAETWRPCCSPSR